MKNLEKIFSPKSIAIVGASPKKGKLGNVLAENIRRGGWRGKLYLVNTKYAKSKSGYFASLGDIKKQVDLALIAIPAPFVNEAIENGAKARPVIRNFAVISAGFKEIGKEGRKLENDLEYIAKKYNLNILGPNCLGFANPAKKLNATFTEMNLRVGRTAVVSQSGALAVALSDWAEEKKIGFSKIISIGNKAVLDESRIIDFLASDKETDSIALYLEDIKNGSDFLKTVSKISSRKPIIVLKAGKTAVGQKAVSSHTGSLAQDEEIVEAVFEKLNVIAAESIEEFQDAIHFISFNEIPKKNEIIILTNAGGPGVMASDFVGKSKKTKLLDFSVDFKKELGKVLPPSASIENPIDVIGDAPPERYKKTLEFISKKYSDNPVLLLLTPQNQTDPEKVARIIEKMQPDLPDLAVCFIGGKKISGALKILEKACVSNFESPEQILKVIDKLNIYQNRRKDNIPLLNPQIKKFRSSIVEKALAEKRKMLFWDETEKIFGEFGIKLQKSISFENFSDLGKKKIPYPCVLKTDDPEIAHRMGNDGLSLNIENKKYLEKSFQRMKNSTKASRFLVQPMIESGLEIIVGMKRDSTFGPIILTGWGGSFTEVFRDKIIATTPFEKKEFIEKISQLKIFPVLGGFRGEKKFDLKAIVNVAEAVSQIAEKYPEIKGIDINPMMIYNNGKESKILDAKIFLT